MIPRNGVRLAHDEQRTHTVLDHRLIGLIEARRRRNGPSRSPESGRSSLPWRARVRARAVSCAGSAADSSPRTARSTDATPGNGSSAVRCGISGRGGTFSCPNPENIFSTNRVPCFGSGVFAAGSSFEWEFVVAIGYSWWTSSSKLRCISGHACGTGTALPDLCAAAVTPSLIGLFSTCREGFAALASIASIGSRTSVDAPYVIGALISLAAGSGLLVPRAVTTHDFPHPVPRPGCRRAQDEFGQQTDQEDLEPDQEKDRGDDQQAAGW